MNLKVTPEQEQKLLNICREYLIFGQVEIKEDDLKELLVEFYPQIKKAVFNERINKRAKSKG